MTDTTTARPMRPTHHDDDPPVRGIGHLRHPVVSGGLIYLIGGGWIARFREDTRRERMAIADAAQDVVRPAMPSECLVDRSSMMMGYAGCYSSFLKHAEGHAQRYNVPASEILLRAGERRLVGGQEDQLIDIALQLQREAQQASA